jgi:hypothetical protein
MTGGVSGCQAPVTPASELGFAGRFKWEKRLEQETSRFQPALESVTRVYNLTTKKENGTACRASTLGWKFISGGMIGIYATSSLINSETWSTFSRFSIRSRAFWAWLWGIFP